MSIGDIGSSGGPIARDRVATNLKRAQGQGDAYGLALCTRTLLYTGFVGQKVRAKILKPRPVQNGVRLTCHLEMANCHRIDANNYQTLR